MDNVKPLEGAMQLPAGTPTGVMTETDLSALRHSKPEVLAIIREQDADRIEERAAIIQFDVYLSRREAERRAGNEQHPDNAA